MKARHQQNGIRRLLGGGSLVVGVVAAAWIGAFAVAQMQAPAVRTAPAARTSAPAKSAAAVEEVDFLAVAEDESWMAAVAAPLAARLTRAGRVPLMIALTSPPTPEAAEAIRLASPRRLLLLTVSDNPKLGPRLTKFAPEVFAIGADPVQGSLALAKRFWDRPKRAVLAAIDDPEGIVLGAALAAKHSMPLLLRDRAESRSSLGKALAELGVDEVLAAVSDAHRAPGWASSRKYKVQLVPPRVAQDQMIAAIGAKQVHTIVVARAPEKRAAVGSTAWLAPYWGLVRGAPVVLTHAASAAVAEADVGRLVRRHGLQPRTITVLADYDSIGDNFVEIENDAAAAPAGNGAPAAAAGKYQLNTEPFVPTDASTPASFGVGRIPLQSLGDASVLFVRGLVRQRRAEARPSPVLLIANSGPERRPLPLCEAISRLTAEEYKNCGFAVDDFYGKLADSPEVLAAAKNAGLILYEGHLAYQDLFDVPSAHRDTAPDSYFEEELDGLEGGTPPAARRSPPRTTPIVSRRRPAAGPQTNQLRGTMEGLPVVVLQSCDSLDERVLWRIDELGGVALVGSVTPIHSGSGSSLVQAMSDAILYRRANLGESLRDAQNFLLCLGDLKNRRGQKEQAKSRRVALSFRLWGDPELQAVSPPQGRPAALPLSARWSGGDRLTIDVPEQRLPEARNAKYVARMFPGSQSSGMVKPGGSGAARRITPVYYFRTRLPDGVPAAGAPPGLDGGSNRLAVRIDPVNKFLYLVFLPEVEKPGETIALRWGAPLTSSRPGRAAK